MGANQNHINETILMSTHNISFYGELANIIFQLSSNEPRHEKTKILHICENKDEDQLRGNCEADQRLCFRYIDSTIPVLSKSEISSL